MEIESRFEKLFKYLEPGTSDLIKQKAADQFATIENLYPDQFPTLVKKLKPYLYHDSWETRVGAALCLNSICKSLKNNSHTFSIPSEKTTEKITDELRCFITDFDLTNFVKECPTVLSGEVVKDHSNKKRKYKPVEATAIDSLINNDDFNFNIDFNSNIIMPSSYHFDRCLIETENKKTIKIIDEYCHFQFKLKFKSMATIENAIDGEMAAIKLNSLTELCDSFLHTLFNENWQVRHGSALALRAIMMNCFDIVCKNDVYSFDKNVFLNIFYMLKVCLYCLCLISIDHFYDFTMDHAVAPVVETCSHVITTIIYNLQSYASSVCDFLLELISYQQWKYKFSALITLRYFVGVCSKDFDQMFKKIFPKVKSCLEGCTEEDVISAACHFLHSNVRHILRLFPNEFALLIPILTKLITQVDDIDSTICEVITLLASSIVNLNDQQVVETSGQLRKFPEEFTISKLYLNLWRLCLHSSNKIVSNTLDALAFLVPYTGMEWKLLEEYDVVKFNMLIIFYVAMIEPNKDVSKSCIKAFSSLLQSISPSALEQMFDWWFSKQFFLIAHPSKIQINLKPPSSAFLDEIPSKPECVGRCIEGDDEIINYSKELSCRITCAKILALLLVDFIELTKSNYIDQIFKISSLMDLNDSVIKQTTCLILIEISKLQKMSCISNPDMLQKLKDGVICQPKILQNPQNSSEKEELFIAINLSECFEKLELKTIENSKKAEKSASYSSIKNVLKGISITELIEAIKKNLELFMKFQRLISQYRQIYLQKYTRTALLCSYVLILVDQVPEKITPIVSTLIDCICEESAKTLKNYSYIGLAKLVDICLSRSNPPTDRIITTLSNKCILSYKIIHGYYQTFPLSITLDDNQTVVIDKSEGVFSLAKHLNPNDLTFDKTNNDNSCFDLMDIVDKILSIKTMFKGCYKALNALINHFGDRTERYLAIILKNSLDIIMEQAPTNKNFNIESIVSDDGAGLIDSLILLIVVVKSMYKVVPHQIKNCLLSIFKLISSNNSLLRHTSSSCFVLILSILPFNEVIHVLYESLFPTMEHSTSIQARQGCVEAVFIILNGNGKKNCLYDRLFKLSIHLIIPILRRMSDSCLQIRYISSLCLSQVMFYMPVDFSERDFLVDFSEVKDDNKRDFTLISQLLNPSSIELLDIPFKVEASFRPYQREGISWLAFLNKLNLNGALCDDMGLGKTIQTLTIIAHDHFMNPNRETPSLIIVPKILLQHWYDEAQKFIPSEILQLSILKSTKKSDSFALPSKLHNVLVIASYDYVRRKIDFFAKHNWNYIVLDEAHIIKNHKSKIFSAILKLKGLHRLALTGTPIQNCVAELWSLFDFLMPGFLGTHSHFLSKYVKPIIKGRDGKCSSTDFEAGKQALESLHKRVLPFILRRLKSDVLKDLPEKIIQDYYCELSDLQRKLYDSCTNKSSVDSFIKDVKEDGSALINQNTQFNHIFKSLHYLRKVCNHPALVIPESDEDLIKSVGGYQALHDLKNNPKLEALRQLLVSCGFSDCVTSSDELLQTVTANQHRVIVFTQFSKTILLIEEDLLKKYLPSINYVRLDSSIKESMRFDVVKQFNEDPSVDLMLATTSIGGLGLNLTSADTVVFYDHDWNPMKDLQAMDRAHRIGQTKVVNVYRIITKNTIEEKIMNLQAFKIKVAGTVVSHENSVTDIKTNKILNVMDYCSGDRILESSEATSCQKQCQTSVSDTYDPNEEYKLEFDVKNFMNLLKNA